MQLDENKVTEIFFILDEFSKNFHQTVKKYSVSDGKRHRNKPNRLSDAEVMLILIMFHDGGYRCLKHYYANYICVHCKHLFPRQVSYNRFVELSSKKVRQSIFDALCFLELKTEAAKESERCAVFVIFFVSVFIREHVFPCFFLYHLHKACLEGGTSIEALCEIDVGTEV